GALLLRELYTGTLLTRQRVDLVRGTPAFQLASAAARRRYLGHRLFDAVDLPLTAAGYSTTLLKLPDGRTERLHIVPHPVDVNPIFYALRLLEGVDYVLTSGGVRSRFEADTVRFAVQHRFYRFLDRAAEHLASFRAAPGVGGPSIDVYRLGPSARAEIARAGRAPALWWADYVPNTYRNQFEQLAVDAGRRSHGALRGTDGELSAWVSGLSGFFDAQISPFARAMAWELAHLDRPTAAKPLAEAIHVMHPENARAAVSYLMCAGALGQWDEVEAASARAIARADSADPALPELRLARARALAGLGRDAAAREELAWVMA